MLEGMMLAGLRVPDDDVRELARLVDEPTRGVLEKALALGTVVLALTIEDRERLLWALDDARTDALAELRGCFCKSTSGEVRKDSSDGGRTLGRSCRLPTKSFSLCSIRFATCIDLRMRSRARKRGSTRTFALV